MSTCGVSTISRERNQGSLGEGAVPGLGREMFQMTLEHLIIKKARGLLEASGVPSEAQFKGVRKGKIEHQEEL